ncbi:hypothetical protein ACJWDR_43330 [Streptomyces tauricus]
MKTIYEYDKAGRFSYAKEEKGTTLNSSSSLTPSAPSSRSPLRVARR